MVAHTLALLAFTLLAAIAGAISDTTGVRLAGLTALVFCIGGMVLHLVRFCDAQAAIALHREGAEHRWPRASADADFVVQLAIAVVVAILIV